MRELTLAIVGLNFTNTDRSKSNRRSELMLLDIGSIMELRLEPKNVADPHAVAVFSPNGIQVGYLTAERAPWIGAKIRAGEEVVAILQGMTDHSGWMRVRIGGGVPTLPAAPAAPIGASATVVVDDGDGFWADPDGPDWGA